MNRIVGLLCAGVSSASQPWVLFPEGQVPGEHPNTFGPEVFGECPWGGAGSARCYQNVTTPTLTPYVVNGSSAAVIVAPGGGYTALSWDNEGTSVAEFLNSIGVSAFVLKYRVPERPWLNHGQPGGTGGAPFMDAQRAIGMVRLKAPQLGLNASRIGFIGFSAGGHLTAHVSNNFSARAYPRIDPADDMSSRPDFALFGYPWVVEDDNKTLMFAVNKEHPPSFLVQAEDDDTCAVENSVLYYLALKQSGAAASELHDYPHGGHGFGICEYNGMKGKLEVCSWPAQAAAFLRRLGVAPTAEVTFV